MTDLFQTLYKHRELIAILVAKQLKLRYRGSALGFLWTFMNPLLMMVVYTLVFSVYFRLEMENYPAFLFSGLLPWIWFVSSLQHGVTSIIEGAGLITKALFPAEVLPVVILTAHTVNFLLTLPLLIGFLLVSQVELGSTVLLLPLLVGLQYLLALGFVLVAAAMNVYFRDLQHILSHLLTTLLFLTPVLYPLSFIPERFQFWALLNPLAILVSSFQDILYFGRFPNWAMLLALLGFSCVELRVATAVFSRYKETFAEAL